MNLSAIGICNAALSALGHDIIRDFSENNKKARMCEILYNINRVYLLSVFDWPFARGFVKLQKISTDEDLPALHALYALPTDCIYPRDLHPIEMHYPWEQVGKSLLIEERDEVFLYYTKDIVNPASFSIGFSAVLSALLAWKLSQPITQNQKLTREMKEAYFVTYTEVLQLEANIGSEYRQADEKPENDTFVYPHAHANT